MLLQIFLSAQKFKWLTLFMSVFVFSPAVVWADIASVTFSDSSPETVEIDKLSSTITATIMNSENSPDDPLTESLSFSLNSNPPTGQFFSNSSTNNNPINISSYRITGSPNKHFKYKNTTPGEYVITISVWNDNIATMTASHTITVNDPSVSTENQNENSATTSDNENSQNNSASSSSSSSSSGGGGLSSHSAQTDLSDAEEKMPAIGAGRKRLVSTGAPISFRAEKSKSAQSGGRFVWSFGDGTATEGGQVEHIYNFSGEYNVVLNGYFGDKQAVARTKVVVEDAKISITEVNSAVGYVELKNNNTKEINLGSWQIGDNQKYIFPADTIIDAGQNLKIPLALIATSSTLGMILSTPDGRLIASWGTPNSPLADLSVAELNAKLSALKSQLVLMRKTAPVLGQTIAWANNDSANFQTTTENRIILTPKLSWWQKLIRIGR